MTDAPARLLRGTPGTPLTLAQHEAMFPAPETPMSLPDQLDASGLTGRGGGAVLTANKARLLAGQKHRAAAVVVNAMEGEPASRKDATLLSTNPHLVLDGAEALGSIIRTNEVIICVARGQRAVIDRVQRAVNERRRRNGYGASFIIQTPPGRYVAGEESALTHWLSEHESLPLYRSHRPSVPRVRERPVLVDNAETCAHVGLIARYGADWFRAVGTESSPGSTLVTVSGAVDAQPCSKSNSAYPFVACSMPPSPNRTSKLSSSGGTAARGSTVRSLTSRTPTSRCSPSARRSARASSSPLGTRAAASPRPRASRNGWPNRALTSADRAPSDCQHWPLTSGRL